MKPAEEVAREWLEERGLDLYMNDTRWHSAYELPAEVASLTALLTAERSAAREEERAERDALRALAAEARETALREALDRVVRIACKGMCKTTAYAGGSRTLHECGEIMRIHSRALLSPAPAPEPGKGGAHGS